MAWYYQRGGVETGPVSSSELKEAASLGRIDAETQVRRDTDERWFPASKVRGLEFDELIFPPPLPDPAADADCITIHPRNRDQLRPREEVQEPASAALVTCPACGHQVSRSAIACPSCGRPRPKARYEKLDQFADSTVRVGCAVFVIVGLFVSLFAWMAMVFG